MTASMHLSRAHALRFWQQCLLVQEARMERPPVVSVGCPSLLDDSTAQRAAPVWVASGFDARTAIKLYLDMMANGEISAASSSPCISCSHILPGHTGPSLAEEGLDSGDGTGASETAWPLIIGIGPRRIRTATLSRYPWQKSGSRLWIVIIYLYPELGVTTSCRWDYMGPIKH